MQSRPGTQAQIARLFKPQPKNIASSHAGAPTRYYGANTTGLEAGRFLSEAPLRISRVDFSNFWACPAAPGSFVELGIVQSVLQQQDGRPAQKSSIRGPRGSGIKSWTFDENAEFGPTVYAECILVPCGIDATIFGVMNRFKSTFVKVSIVAVPVISAPRIDGGAKGIGQGNTRSRWHQNHGSRRPSLMFFRNSASLNSKLSCTFSGEKQGLQERQHGPEGSGNDGAFPAPNAKRS